MQDEKNQLLQTSIWVRQVRIQVFTFSDQRNGLKCLKIKKNINISVCNLNFTCYFFN